MSKSMPPDEARAIVIAERVSSVFSVVGAFFIIGTFLSDPRFRKPINRLVFYASWGNLLANVATLISRSGIELGVTSPLCQFQACLIQWYPFQLIDTNRSNGKQVHAGGRIMDFCHGLQCLLDLLQTV